MLIGAPHLSKVNVSDKETSIDMSRLNNIKVADQKCLCVLQTDNMQVLVGSLLLIQTQAMDTVQVRVTKSRHFQR